MAYLLEEMPNLLGVFCGLLGLLVGSFLNVVIYRLPRSDLSVCKGRSRCPACRVRITWYDNIPIISWLLLGGRCRSPQCNFRIPLRYPLIELATGLLFLWLFHLTRQQTAGEGFWLLLFSWMRQRREHKLLEREGKTHAG